jgi:2,3-bisphosphoglycerate-dependent phosphoglycerate mutase
MPMKHLLLIRHALPHEGHATSPIDPPLHDDGHRHAQRLAQALASALSNEGIDRIVCSPQQRALDTAAPLVELLGLELEVIEGLAEVDRFAGVPYRSAETLRAMEPQRWAEFVASPARFLGVDPVAYRQTVRDTFTDLISQPRGRRIAVFSHGMTIKTMLNLVLGLETEGHGHFSIGHCSVTRLSGRALEQMRIDSVNEALAR